MTKREKQAAIDSLLGTPSRAETKRAIVFLESFGSYTQALTAIVAVMREADQWTEASMLEGLLEDMATVEVESDITRRSRS